MSETLHKNDEITLKIETVTSECSGLGRYEGMVVFVPFTAEGDTVRVRILKVNKNIAYGKLISVLDASADRIVPDCAVFGMCGGCQLRHINYEAELRNKSRFIYDAFTRIGHLSPEFLPTIPNAATDAYRNKAQYPLGRDKDGKAIYGYYAAHSHRIVAHSECGLQEPVFKEIADFILAFIRKSGLSVYSEEQKQGVLRHICIRKSHACGEINVCLVARRKTPEMVPLAKMLTEKFPQITGVVLNINKDDTNVILGKDEIVLTGVPTINDRMCGLDVEISPKSFYQVNTPQAEKLYALAREFAEPSGKTIVDLYCGAGIIGMSMASQAKEIIGIEIVKSAVENAERIAEKNGIKNASFICADASVGTQKLVEQGKKADVVLLDPARKGADKATLDNIVKLSPERIVMVSCNAATAARDCAYLCQNGYECVKVQGVDMFSRTEHVESVVLMSRTDK